MKRKNDKKYFKILSLLTFVFVALMTVGYSSYSSDLYISGGKAVIRIDRNVRVTGVRIESVANGGESTGEDYDIYSIFSDVRLPQSNSTVTYEVEVKNFGNVEMGIESISLPSNLQSILDVSISGYTLGDKIRDNNDSCEESVDGCKLSIKRKFLITLSYKNGAYNSNNYIFNNVTLNFTFKEMHKVTYTGFTIMHPSMQARTIMDGHTYSYNIGPYDTLLIKMGGVIITNYTVGSNNLLTIPNVTDDLEIIISEVMLDFRITATPNDARIDYTVEGVSKPYATGTLNTQIAIGSHVTVTVSKYGYRTQTRNYTISNNVTDSFTLDQVYYLNLSTDLNDATIAYTVNGVAQTSVTQTLSDEYDPGTLIVATITRPNYRTEVRNYTMNQHYSETVNMVRQYIYKAITSVPSSQNLTMTKGGSTEPIVAGVEYAIDTGTTITITASASGYRTKTIPHTMTQDFTDTIELTKTYIYTVGTVSPSSASLNLKVTTNNSVVYNGSIAAGGTYEADINSNLELTASASGYRSKTYTKNNLTSNYTQNVSLLQEYTFTLYLASDVQVNMGISSIQPQYTLNNKTVSQTKTISSNKLSATITACIGDKIEYNITMPYFRNNSSLSADTAAQTKTINSTSDLSATIKLYPNLTTGTYNVITQDSGLVVSRKSTGSKTCINLPTYVYSIDSTNFKLDRLTNGDITIYFCAGMTSCGSSNAAYTWSPSGIGASQTISNTIWTTGSGLYPVARSFGVTLENRQTLFGATMRDVNYNVHYGVQ